MSVASQKSSSWKLIPLLLVMTAVVTIMLLWIAGVFHPKVEQTTAGSSSDRRLPADALTETVQWKEYARFESFAGTVRPVHESTVSSRLLARIVEMNAVAGQLVRQGDILARLDDSDLQSQLKQSAAAQAAAQAQSEQARTDFERVSKLREQKAVSLAEFDAAETSLRSAAAGLDRANQALHEAEVRLDFATIRSPMDGTIIEKRVEVGDTVGPGQPILVLYDPAKMQMVASVRETLAARLKVGQTVPTRLEALGYECDATISEIVPEADADTRSMTIKVTGPCPPGIYSGMFGRVMIPVDPEKVLTVAESTVYRVGQLTLVDVVHDGRIERRNVRIGRVLGDRREILAGLSEGEVVVLRQD